MIAKVQRTRMSPDGFYPAVAFNRRIPKLARTGKFGRSGFFFHRARRILFRQDEKEWGVHSPPGNQPNFPQNLFTIRSFFAKLYPAY